MDERGVREVLEVQGGVISRRQLIRHGATPADVERLLRRRELTRLLPGVFVNHTGEPTWLQRAWAGVLYFAPAAALSHDSAIRAAAGPGWRRHRDEDPIRIAVPGDRKLVEPPGYRLRRMRGLEGRVLWNASPPRVRLEDAVLDMASARADEMAVVGVLADIVQARRTTARRLLYALEARPRVAQRDWIKAVLEDVAEGTCSVLEHRYLTRVERAHGLPPGARQRQATSGAGQIQRDVTYPKLGQVVELDGRLFHDTPARRDADLERDLDASLDGLHSVRLGWGQVVGRSCSTALKVGRLLQVRGWAGAPVPCGPDCLFSDEPATTR
jgi:hypothetical protein